MKRHTPIWRNWSGSLRCEPSHCAQPASLEEIQAEVVRAADEGERLRVVGSGASAAPLCWTDDNHMSLAHFTGIDAADVQRHRVWVRAGTSLQQLYELLADRDLALEIAPSFSAATIGGAISTASHGSGLAFGNLSSLVTGLRMVLADGSVRQYSREQHPEHFDAARVSLGALGVISHVELQCVDHYRLYVAQKRSSFGETLARLTETRREHRNYELHWFPYAGMVLQRSADETRVPPEHPLSVKAARARLIDRLMIRAARRFAQRSPQAAERAGALVASHVRFRAGVRNAEDAYQTDRITRVLHLEYAIPIERTVDTLRQLERLIRALDFRIHVPIEVRFVHRDDAWLSPQYQRDTACITLPAYHNVAHAGYFAAISELFDRVDGRPHWATAHDKTAAELHQLYPRFEDFRRLRAELDPRGLFLNPHLAKLFGASLR